MATLFLMVGLPAAGKTTRARSIAAEHGALRLSPDEWMIPLFGESDADGKRDVLEGRLVWVARESLRVGMNVVLDFGLWGRDERSALRWLAAAAGASCSVVYVPVQRSAQWDRVRTRWDRTPGATFPISQADLDTWRARFEVPGPDELDGDRIDDPPAPWTDWRQWAAHRWPSLDPD